MASLIPCSHCLRHVRREETQCPFCGAARTPAAAAARPVLREAKRATLFALGLTLAGQACGGKEDEGNKNRDNVGLIPPYGIGPAELSGGSGGAGGGDTSGLVGEGGDQSIHTVPPYGGIGHPPPEGGSGGAEESDAGAPDDAGSDDAGGAPDAAR